MERILASVSGKDIQVARKPTLYIVLQNRCKRGIELCFKFLGMCGSTETKPVNDSSDLDCKI